MVLYCIHMYVYFVFYQLIIQTYLCSLLGVAGAHGTGYVFASHQAHSLVHSSTTFTFRSGSKQVGILRSPPAASGL